MMSSRLFVDIVARRVPTEAVLLLVGEDSQRKMTHFVLDFVLWWQRGQRSEVH